MAITKRPTGQVSNAVDVEALINKGGSVGRSAESLTPQEEQEKTALVNLRLPTSLLAEIDEVIKSKRVKIPRHTWLLEAIAERLTNEKEELVRRG
ncbi:hypothetical protein [Armatimonas sp.]|uniref:hypothetical protein n=1 Tax=Armatimonas sp. TaxID=1872638 RepID=UPI00286B8A5C|nr:hypothetical protein [Armatimonas sp.]